MKKVLSLVLAAVMVLGMGVTAFAAWDLDTANAGVDPFSDVDTTYTSNVYPGQKITFTLNKADIVANASPRAGTNDELIRINSIGALSAFAAQGNNETAIAAPVTAGTPTQNANAVTFVVTVSDRVTVGEVIHQTATLDTIDIDAIDAALVGLNTDIDWIIEIESTVVADPTDPDDPDDTTKPTVTSAVYSYTNATSARLTVKFSKAMNTAYGDVDFDNFATVSKGSWEWTSNNTLVISMTGLTAGRAYNVLLTDFRDTAGNVMTATTSVTLPFTHGTSTNNYPKATEGKVTAFRDGYSLYYGYSDTGALNRYTGAAGRYQQIDLDDVYPADEQVETIWLLSSMFNWNTAGAYYNTSADYYLTSQIVRNSKVSARTQVAAGSKAISGTTIEYDGGCAYVEVEFVDEWVSVDSLDFEFTTYILIDGKRADTDGEGLTFYGTLKNHVIYVYSNDDYVDTSLGEVAHAQDFVSSIEVDLGSGVSIFTKFFKDKKYYGTATRDADEAADVVFAKYPDVDNVVILKTVGLNSTGDIVKLDTDYSDYYVYDKDLNYLGQSNTRLPFSSRYYLANRKLDVDSDYEAEDPGEEPEWTDNAETGGDAGVSNANANPGTGR